MHSNQVYLGIVSVIVGFLLGWGIHSLIRKNRWFR